jgi:hypothetical protein
MWVGIAVLAGLLCLLAGCEDVKEKCNDCGGWPWIGVSNIIIQMDSDTLFYLPGDTVTSRGFVVVTDHVGSVLPNAVVRFSLSENFGSIEFVDQARRDTTNAIGRVEFLFRACAANPGPGYNTITATSEGVSAQWWIAVMPETDIFSRYWFHVTVVPNRLVLSPPLFADSTLVTLTLTDSRGNPTHEWNPNELIRLSSCAGGWTAFPDFDSTGTTFTWWHLVQNPGTCCVFFRNDSACVVVDSAR